MLLAAGNPSVFPQVQEAGGGHSGWNVGKHAYGSDQGPSWVNVTVQSMAHLLVKFKLAF